MTTPTQCPKCGALVDDTVQNCPKCFTVLVPNYVPPPSVYSNPQTGGTVKVVEWTPPAEAKSPVVAIVIVAVLAMIALGAFVFVGMANRGAASNKKLDELKAWYAKLEGDWVSGDLELGETKNSLSESIVWAAQYDGKVLTIREGKGAYMKFSSGWSEGIEITSPIEFAHASEGQVQKAGDSEVRMTFQQPESFQVSNYTLKLGPKPGQATLTYEVPGPNSVTVKGSETMVKCAVTPSDVKHVVQAVERQKAFAQGRTLERDNDRIFK